MDDDQEGKLWNQCQPLEKPAVCHEELNNGGDRGSQMDVGFLFLKFRNFLSKRSLFV